MNRIGKLNRYMIAAGTLFVSLFCYAEAERNIFDVDAYPSVRSADESALIRYFELLDLCPKLKREGDLNDHTKGTYENLYDLKDILAVRKEVYERLYVKSKLSGDDSRTSRRIGGKFLSDRGRLRRSVLTLDQRCCYFSSRVST